MTHTAEGDAATSVSSTRRGLLGASLAGAALSLIAGRARERLHRRAGQRRRPHAAPLRPVARARRPRPVRRGDRGGRRRSGVRGAGRPARGVRRRASPASSANPPTPATTRCTTSVEATFAGPTATAVATAGYDLESAAVATHIELLAHLDERRRRQAGRLDAGDGGPPLRRPRRPVRPRRRPRRVARQHRRPDPARGAVVNAAEPRATFDRRQLLRTGGLTVSLGAIIAACGEDRAGGTDPGRVGEAPSVTPLAEGDRRRRRPAPHRAVARAHRDRRVCGGARARCPERRAGHARATFRRRPHRALGRARRVHHRGGRRRVRVRQPVGDTTRDRRRSSRRSTDSDDLLRDVLNIAHGLEIARRRLLPVARRLAHRARPADEDHADRGRREPSRGDLGDRRSPEHPTDM